MLTDEVPKWDSEENTARVREMVALIKKDVGVRLVARRPAANAKEEGILIARLCVHTSIRLPWSREGWGCLVHWLWYCSRTPKELAKTRCSCTYDDPEAEFALESGKPMHQCTCNAYPVCSVTQYFKCLPGVQQKVCHDKALLYMPADFLVELEHYNFFCV